MTIAKHIVALLLALGAAHALGQTPYAGQHERSIKALSDEEIRQYLSGAGMGYAKAAELNGFPGPMHVLELADELRLSAEQREATRRLMDSHKAEARSIGVKRIDAEKRLNFIFQSSKVDERALAEAVRTAAAVEGDYRLSHLETHRRMRLLLTDEQVARYNQARGYSSPAGDSPHKH